MWGFFSFPWGRLATGAALSLLHCLISLTLPYFTACARPVRTGDFGTLDALSGLADTLGLPVIGVSTDPAKSAVDEFISKLGCAIPELAIKKLRASFPLAFDPAKTVKTAFQSVRRRWRGWKASLHRGPLTRYSRFLC